jgi:flagellar hook-associated protein 2
MATVGSVTGLLTKTGVGGLSSGMDIDALVTKMTAASRQKITNQEKSLQILEWKQTAYRSVTTALTEFRDKYLNALSKTNFKSSSLYNTIRAAVGKDVTAFTATAQSNAVSGKAYVNSIQQLATGQYVTSNTSLSSPLQGVNTAAFKNLGDFVSSVGGQSKDFMMTLDGVSRTVVIDSAFTEDLKRIALDDPSKTFTPPTFIDPANPSKAELAAFDLSVVADPDKQAEYLQQALQNRVNELFDTATSTHAINVTVTNALSVEFAAAPGRESSRLTLGYATQPATVSETDPVTKVKLTKDEYEAAVKAAHEATGLGALGFEAGQSNKVNLTSSIADMREKLTIQGILTKPTQTIAPDGTKSNNYRFIINNTSISVNEDESLSNLMSKINASGAGVTLTYSEVTDKFTLTSKTQGAGQNIVMGDMNGNLLSALGLVNDGTNNLAEDMVYGENAIAYIDGEKIERTSNEFTVNGVAYSLKGLYKENFTPTPAEATQGEEVTLAPDATDLLQTVKDFVADYNALIDLLYGTTNEEKFSDYEPLTEEQRAAMSESQIKSWEEKAKSGLLRSDSTVSKILSSMREAFLTSTGGFGLINMGITHGTTTASYKNNGKLEITDEAKLKAALESQPDQVRDFFTNASKGAITKLDTVIDNAVRTTGGQGHRGSLIEMAGMPSTMSEKENSIYTQLLNHSKRIDSLKVLLEKEESRLWTKFSAMESALAKLNEQNSMLTQYLGTGKSS